MSEEEDVERVDFGFSVYPRLSLRLPGGDEVTVLEVSWPDGSVFTRSLRPSEMNTVVEVPHPSGAELTPLANGAQVVGQHRV